MTSDDKINILLVDDQPAKLLSYETILHELNENLIRANSAHEAFQHLLKTDVAVILVDVFMPDLDGFELARLIRQHPRYQKTAIIFISAVLLTDLDFLKGYRYGAVDYVSVPVIPEILRAKVKVFAELYRKTEQLERLNRELEKRVEERTAALEASTAELRLSEQRLRMAFKAAKMGWWDYDIQANKVTWSPGLVRMMGFSPESFDATLEGALEHVHPDDQQRFRSFVQQDASGNTDASCELRFLRPDGSIRWSLAAGQIIRDHEDRPTHFAGIDLDITDRKQAEERQAMLAQELDHRAKNLLAVVQSVMRLTRAATLDDFIAAVDGRIRALSRAHTLLSESRWRGVDFADLLNEEIAAFATGDATRFTARGPKILLRPVTAQSLALALHELATNAAKYGALSRPEGRVSVTWDLQPEGLEIQWSETSGPPTAPPSRQGFGTKVIAVSIESQLRGQATFNWLPEGLVCRFAIPRSQVDTAADSEHEQHRGEPIETRVPTAIGGRRVLLVEDDALIAEMMRRELSDLGYIVVGPVKTISQALSTAAETHFDAAILDVNLNGVPVYPVADALMAREIPFVFITGYRADAIDRRYGNVRVLEKPIQRAVLRELFALTAAGNGNGADRSVGPKVHAQLSGESHP